LFGASILKVCENIQGQSYCEVVTQNFWPR